MIAAVVNAPERTFIVLAFDDRNSADEALEDIRFFLWGAGQDGIAIGPAEHVRDLLSEGEPE